MSDSELGNGLLNCCNDQEKKMKFAETRLLIVKDTGMHLNLVTSFPTYAGIDRKILLCAGLF